ncbi:MAG: histidinol-phosphate transaminase [Rhodospirillaceae bacterium]
MTVPKSAAAQPTGLAFNPHVAGLPSYNAGLPVAVAREVSGHDFIARLASNENPFGCSPKVMAALASSAFEPWRYADPAARDLRAALANHLGIDAAEIVCGNGSEEMIAAISRAFLTPGALAVTVVPSFGLHEIEPLAAGAKVIKVPMTEDLTFDIPAIEDALSNRAQVFFISSPSNPVGVTLDHAALQRLVAASGPSTLFVLDEAYREFTEPGFPDGLRVLRNLNVPHVILRTFSKAYGLAGLRVGYAACSNAEIARVINAAKTPFNVNAAAQLGAIAALEDDMWMRDAVARINAERERVRKVMDGLGVFMAPSQTNFLFLDCKGDSSACAQFLLEQGVIVKGWREAGYERFLRVTIGAKEENEKFIAAFRKWLDR